MAHKITDIACPACGNRLTKKEALSIYSQVHSLLLRGKTTPRKSAAARENDQTKVWHLTAVKIGKSSILQKNS